MKAFRLLLTVLFRSLRALGQSRSNLVLENVALRQQIAVLTRTRCLPRLQAEDRLLWVALLRVWDRWQDVLVIVKPETVVGWHPPGASRLQHLKAALLDARRELIDISRRNRLLSTGRTRLL